MARELSRPLRLLHRLAAHPRRGRRAPSSSCTSGSSRSATTARRCMIVSTELDEVLELADRIAVLYQGRLVGHRPRRHRPRRPRPDDGRRDRRTMRSDSRRGRSRAVRRRRRRRMSVDETGKQTRERPGDDGKPAADGDAAAARGSRRARSDTAGRPPAVRPTGRAQTELSGQQSSAARRSSPATAS